jgi:hypothetical protein
MARADRVTDGGMIMRHCITLALLTGAAALLTGCATPPPPDAEAQAAATPTYKCDTVTGSRIASTCSNTVKSTTNQAAMREMQRHAPMSGQ